MSCRSTRRIRAVDPRMWRHQPTHRRPVPAAPRRRAVFFRVCLCLLAVAEAVATNTAMAANPEAPSGRGGFLPPGPGRESVREANGWEGWWLIRRSIIQDLFDLPRFPLVTDPSFQRGITCTFQPIRPRTKIFPSKGKSVTLGTGRGDRSFLQAARSKAVSPPRFPLVTDPPSQGDVRKLITYGLERPGFGWLNHRLQLTIP